MLDQSYYQKIYNAFLERLYFYILLNTSNTKNAIEIMFNVFEKIFVYSNNLNNINEKIIKECDKQIKSFLLNINNNQTNKIIDYEVPLSIYKLNFNIYKFFNEIDNFIFVNMIVYNTSIDKISMLVKMDQIEVLTRFKRICLFIKKMIIENNYIKEKDFFKSLLI